jgi:hypothetical protein
MYYNNKNINHVNLIQQKLLCQIAIIKIIIRFKIIMIHIKRLIIQSNLINKQ